MHETFKEIKGLEEMQKIYSSKRKLHDVFICWPQISPLWYAFSRSQYHVSCNKNPIL